MADVYKLKQSEVAQEQNYNYIPKVTFNMEDRTHSYTRKPQSEGTEGIYFAGSTSKKAPMTSRWAKPAAEITNPGGSKSGISTPRLEGFAYKSAFTRNSNKETSMMEKYCSNSVGEILNWGQ